MESIKFGNTIYELVANGYQIENGGGKIIFSPSLYSFAEVESDLKSMNSITMLDSNGEPSLTRTDLVYAGQLTKDDNYVIGADSEQGIDIIGTVMIAVFRLPDVREQLASVQAKLEYMAMMTDVELEV